MRAFAVTEVPRGLKPVTPDPFLDGLDGAASAERPGGARATRGGLDRRRDRFGWRATPTEPELVRDSGAAAGLWLESERLEAELRARTVELRGSPARLVDAGDAERRRIERDLHDGTQQRLVSVGLELRAAQTMVPPELPDLSAQLSHGVRDLLDAVKDLQEVSRGIHPAILSRGGLGPALRTLARRAAVPVELDVRTDRRLPERVEVAVYYVASEALTNAAKHAHASVMHLDLEADDTTVQLSIRDDGVGGADPTRGSGLVGLRDRIEALGGNIEITSPAGGGTSLIVRIPVDRAGRERAPH